MSLPLSFHRCTEKPEFVARIIKASDSQLAAGIMTGHRILAAKDQSNRHKCGIAIAEIVGWIESEVTARGAAQ